MHVFILLGVIVLLCGGRRRLAAMIGIPVIVFFVLMTGASASAVRAGVMQTLLLLAPLIRREYDAPTSLGAAALALMLENPWTLMDIGFQLSFASVAGILLFARRLYQPLMEKKWFRKLYYGPAAVHKLAMSMASAFCCSIASMVFFAAAGGVPFPDGLADRAALQYADALGGQHPLYGGDGRRADGAGLEGASRWGLRGCWVGWCGMCSGRRGCFPSFHARRCIRKKTAIFWHGAFSSTSRCSCISSCRRGRGCA